MKDSNFTNEDWRRAGAANHAFYIINQQLQKTNDFTKQTITMNENQPTNSQEPEFNRLLNALREEISKNEELINQARRLANFIKKRNPEKTDPSDQLKSKEPTGIIETYWSEVHKLCQNNVELAGTINHLQKLIGS